MDFNLLITSYASVFTNLEVILMAVSFLGRFPA